MLEKLIDSHITNEHLEDGQYPCPKFQSLREGSLDSKDALIQNAMTLVAHIRCMVVPLVEYAQRKAVNRQESIEQKVERVLLSGEMLNLHM